MIRTDYKKEDIGGNVAGWNFTWRNPDVLCSIHFADAWNLQHQHYSPDGVNYPFNSKAECWDMIVTEVDAVYVQLVKFLLGNYTDTASLTEDQLKKIAYCLRDHNWGSAQVQTQPLGVKSFTMEGVYSITYQDANYIENQRLSPLEVACLNANGIIVFNESPYLRLFRN